MGGSWAGAEAQEGSGGQVDGDEEAGRHDAEELTGREAFPPEDGGGCSQGLQT